MNVVGGNTPFGAGDGSLYERESVSLHAVAEEFQIGALVVFNGCFYGCSAVGFGIRAEILLKEAVKAGGDVYEHPLVVP